MATMITTECINCGACEPECPNTAIYQGGVEWQAPDGAMHAPLSEEIFYIVPEKCTECVGFHDAEACAAVCPVDCCVPNPEIPETHEVLLERSRVLHPELTIPDDAPSRFKAGDGAAAPAAATPAAAAAPTAAAPAPAPKAAAPRAAAGSGKVEKPVSPPAKRPSKTFAGELPQDYETILASLGAARRTRTGGLALVPLALLGLGQGILGALPGPMKRRIEEAVGDGRFFSAELATAANVFLNLFLYPIITMGIALATGKGFFTSDGRWWLVLGVLLGFGEAAWRLRESFFGGVPIAESPLRAAIYGPAIVPLGAIVLGLAGRRGAESGVGFDGFYDGAEHFDDKTERARRYGEVYKLEDRDDAYLLRMEFPRQVPPSSLRDHLSLPDEMPDYDYELSVQGGSFVVHGRVADEQVRKMTGVAPAFPSEFTTRVPLGTAVAGFRHRYRDKVLEVVLPKAPES